MNKVFLITQTKWWIFSPKADAAAVPVPGLPKFDAGVLVVPKEKFAVGVLCPNPGAVVPGRTT